jgi:NADH-quinone oxidoreductase subunit H
MWDSVVAFVTHPVTVAVIAAAILMGLMLVQAIIFVWLERKVAGRIQDRLGPTRVGGKFGWLQTLADGIKLLCKEDFIPAAADQFLFRLAAYLVIIGSFLPFLAMPFGLGVVALDMNIAAFYILAALSTEVFGVILAGYGSGSKWALFGAMREAAQMVSYEVPRSLCVVIPIVATGTMSLSLIVQQQAGFFWNWLLFANPFTFLAFWVLFVSVTASCKRAPFDLAEAESELVAGFHTEFSGFRWLLLFMGEYGSMFITSALCVVLFLGGWHTGVLPQDPTAYLGRFLGNVVNVIVFLTKSWLLVFVMMWVRWTLPRLRIDQVMMTCLKYLIPISAVLLLGVSLYPLLWNTLAPGALQIRAVPGIPAAPPSDGTSVTQADGPNTWPAQVP